MSVLCVRMSVVAGHQRVVSVVSILLGSVVDLLMRNVSKTAGECQLDLSLLSVQETGMMEAFVLSVVRMWLSG